MLKRPGGSIRQRTIHPERVMALGFLLVILAGTLLLALPAATQTGQSIGLGRSLFTATSAVCVTGLIVVDTGTTFSIFGQIVLLALIQTGGLGFMVFATLTWGAMGRRITLRNRVLIRESMGAGTLQGVVELIKWYGLMAVLIELAGAAILALRFVPALGWGRGLYFGLWHSVSAFCNAGFDLFGHFSSLTGWNSDPVVLLTVAMLIVLGGLGFSVMDEVIHRRTRRRMSLHARIVLVMTASLLAAGTVFFLAAEWNNEKTMGGMSLGDRAANAFLQSATMRTAGFNSVDLMSMRDSSKLMSVILMFIGASPASTGGGVKTTTVSVLLLIMLSVIRGDDDVNVMGRRLPTELMRRALSILFITLAILLGGTMVLTIAEGGRYSFLDLLFETTSAMATVGVSSVGTPNLTTVSKAVLVPMMYFGRVGPLTMAVALASRQHRNINRIHYPEENIPIG